jgi:hypothetical protein
MRGLFTDFATPAVVNLTSTRKFSLNPWKILTLSTEEIELAAQIKHNGNWNRNLARILSARDTDTGEQSATPPGTESPPDSLAAIGTPATQPYISPLPLIAPISRFQIGAAASNALNHPNYASPSNLSVGTAGFSSITNVQSQDAGGPRAIQITSHLRF